MTSNSPVLAARSALFAVSVAGVASFASAQIPDGAHVTSVLKVPTVWPGDSGIFVAHPRDPGTLTPITGLPESVSYASDNDPGAFGANCVLFDPSNGGVVVGVNGRAGQDIDLHRLTLDGLQVTQVQRYRLGTLVANGGGVFEMDWIDAEEVVCAVGAISGPVGTPGTHQVGRVDLTTGAVAPVDLRGFSSTGFINAIAYDAVTDALYFGIGGLPGGVSELWAMPLNGTSAPTLLATFTGSLRNLAVDESGDVLAGLAVAPGSGGATLVRVTAGGQTTTLSSTFDNVNCFAIEPTTGQIAIGGQPDGTDPNLYGLYFFDRAGSQTVSQLSIVRAGGGPAGPVSGVDVAPSPVAYGQPSGVAAFAWNEAPDPRRLAVAGGRFHAPIDWPAGVRPIFGAYQVSARSAAIRLTPRLDLLVDPCATVLAGALRFDAGARQSLVTFPLASAAKGATVYLQAFHVVRGGIAATAGLRVRVQ